MSNDIALFFFVQLFIAMTSLFVPMIVYYWIRRAIFD